MSQNIEMQYLNSSGQYVKIVPHTITSDNSCFLSTSVASLYGLSTSATPNDVLSFLGKYNLHWWKRRLYRITENIVNNTSVILVDGTNAQNTLSKMLYIGENYSKSEGIYQINVITSFQMSYSNMTYQVSTISNKYFTLDAENSNTMYYYPSTATMEEYSSGGLLYGRANGVTKYTISTTIGGWEYVTSSNPNAYPKSGISNDYEYSYIGVPFNNIIDGGNIFKGRYMGTGGYGVNNKNSLTFGFSPKIIFLVRQKKTIVVLEYYIVMEISE